MKEIVIAIPYFQKMQKLNLWMQRRVDHNPELNGKLEFPGGKIEGEESQINALKREVLEECSVVLGDEQIELLKTIEHQYSDRFVRLHFYLIHCRDFNQFSQNNWYEWDLAQKSPSFLANVPAANLDIFELLGEYGRHRINLK